MLRTLCLVGAVLLSAALTGPPPLEMRVNPRMGQSPKDVTVFVKLDPHKDNRWLTVAVDNGRFGVSTLVDLGVPEPPETLTRTFRRLPEGHYIAVVSLQRATGNPIQQTAEFCLSGMNTSCVN